MGLCCIGSSGLLGSLGMSTIFALHSYCGMICSLHISCTRLTVIRCVTRPPYLSSSAVSLSGPGAFLIGRCYTMSPISLRLGGSVIILWFSPISSSSRYSVVQYSLKSCFLVVVSVGCGFSRCLVAYFSIRTMSHASLAPAICCSILLCSDFCDLKRSIYRRYSSRASLRS